MTSQTKGKRESGMERIRGRVEVTSPKVGRETSESSEGYRWNISHLQQLHLLHFILSYTTK
jgi:hypothetical protein